MASFDSLLSAACSILRVTRFAKAIKDIADRSGFSPSSLSRALLILRDAELVLGLPGRGGGYRLGRSPSLISLEQVSAAVALSDSETPFFNSAADGTQATALRDALRQQLRWQSDKITLADSFLLRLRPEDSAGLLNASGPGFFEAFSRGVGVIAVNDAGQVVAVNHKAQEVTGCIEENAMGQSVSYLFPHAPEKLRTNRLFGSAETMILEQAKGEKTLVLQVPLLDRTEHSEGWLFILLQPHALTSWRDLTPVTLLKANEALLAAMTVDLSDVATIISSHVALAPEPSDYALPEQNNPERAAAKRLRTTVHQLASFGRSNPAASLPTAEMLRAVVIHTVGSRGIQLRMQLPLDLAPLNDGGLRAAALIQDICASAVDIVGSGSLLAVSAACIKANSEEQLEDGQYVKVHIRGKGSSRPVMHGREPHLHAARLQALALKGMLVIESTTPELFDVTLYLRARPSDSTEQEPQRKPRALVVDDDPLVLKVLARSMNVLSYEVETAATASEGVKRHVQALAQGETIDLVIGDPVSHTAGMAPEEFLRRLRKTDPAVKVVLTTSEWLLYSTNSSEIHVMDGFEAILCKPFSLTDLRKSLGHLLPRS